MDTSFILMILSASTLPLLAFLALLLRGNLFKGNWKIAFLILGLALLFFVIFDTFKEHGEDFGWMDIITAFIKRQLAA